VNVQRSDVLIFAPTYNERDTAGPLLDALLALSIRADILIVDDSSSDGTTDYLLARAAAEPRLSVIVRPGKLGIGTAHKLGWLYAREHGYSRIVTLDADLSHDPADVPRLLAALDGGADVVIGSRFAAGGRLDYHGWRRVLSTTANRLARRLLGLKVSEYTTSLRAARLDRVPPGLVELLPADGYSFFMTCIVRLARQGLAMTEVPIHFHDRREGVSKMPRHAVFEGMVTLLRLVVDRRPRGYTPLAARAERVCPACGEPFVVPLPSGERRCLRCFGAGVRAQAGETVS